MRGEKIILTVVALAGMSAPAFNLVAWKDQRSAIRSEAAKFSKEYVKFAERVESPAENVTIPIETFPDGKVKSSIFAERAYLFMQENRVWGENVLVREFNQAGGVVGSFRAKNILVDRGNKTGWVPGVAEIEYSGTIVSGRGDYVDFKDRFVSIVKDARVVSRNLQLKDAMGALQADAKVKRDKRSKSLAKIATISSDHADYDNVEGVILFEGKVSATNGDYELCSDRLWVFLEGTNQLRRIVVEGSVAMTNGTRSATCDQAVYSRAESKLTLFGGNGEPARLTEGGGRKGDIEGSKIVFWTDSEQVEVMDSKITVETPGLRDRSSKAKRRTEKR